MFAIVNIAGQQFKVEVGNKVYVHRLAENEGAAITFDEVLLVSRDSDVRIGKPTVSGASVSAKVLSHLKGDKVIIYKKKEKKRIFQKMGHRQSLTQILVESINA